MTEKKRCELCDNLAAMYCESDRSNLCWDCDSRVHGANFLAAKHSRNLLCRSCQRPTPWNASGPRLATTVSVCEKCLDRRTCDDHGNATRSSYGEGGGDDNDCVDGHGDRNGGAADGDGNEENQVVPNGSSLAPVVVASPSSRASHSGAAAVLGKRSREEPELCSVWASTLSWKKHRVLTK